MNERDPIFKKQLAIKSLYAIGSKSLCIRLSALFELLRPLSIEIGLCEGEILVWVKSLNLLVGTGQYQNFSKEKNEIVFHCFLPC